MSLNQVIVIEAEVVQPDDKLVKYAGETGLEKSATETLVQAFAPVFAKARTALATAQGVAASVKDATCVTEIKKSRACRLAIRAVRLEGETIHKKQKESALRFGRAVDGFRNILLADLEPVEQALQDAEDTAERAEAARKSLLKATRTLELCTLMDLRHVADLGEMPEAEYSKLLEDAKLVQQLKIDAAAKAEADRLAKIEADRKERERINAENSRLQAEAAETRRLADIERQRIEAERAEERRKATEEAARLRDAARIEHEKAAAKAKAEREAVEKKLAEERAAAAKLQAELNAKAKAEKDAADAAALLAKRAAAAPDKAKMVSFVDTIRAVPLPGFADDTLHQELMAEVCRLVRWIQNKAQTL